MESPRGGRNSLGAFRLVNSVEHTRNSIFSICHSPQKSSVAQKVYKRALSVTFGDSSPKGGATGRPGHFLLDAESPIWRKRAGLATEGSSFWTSAPCQAVAGLDSGALPFPGHRALLVQWKPDRHARGSPFGGAGERSETERARPLPNSSCTAIVSL